MRTSALVDHTPALHPTLLCFHRLLLARLTRFPSQSLRSPPPTTAAAAPPFHASAAARPPRSYGGNLIPLFLAGDSLGNLNPFVPQPPIANTSGFSSGEHPVPGGPPHLSSRDKALASFEIRCKLALVSQQCMLSHGFGTAKCDAICKRFVREKK